MMLPISHHRPDDFQTPPEALYPLLKWLPKKWTIWECADGSGNLVKELRNNGYKVVGTDILTGHDFRMYEPPHYDCIITNPPYTLKGAFLARAYSLKKPFAFLLPLTTLETEGRQIFFRNYGTEIVLFNKRINFETPNKKENSKSWFSTAWFTHGLGIGKELTFVKMKTKVYG